MSEIYYKKFIIKQYKAISDELIINLSDKNGVYPMIGINESGKTTILKGIMAFDCKLDNSNEEHKHLEDVGNKYTDKTEAQISAILEVSKSILEKSDFLELISEEKDKNLFHQFLLGTSAEEIEIRIDRVIKNDKGKYSFEFTNKDKDEEKIISNEDDQHHISLKILKYTAPIFYFDDFSDRLEYELNLKEDNTKSATYQTFDRIFKKCLDKEEFELHSLTTEQDETSVKKKVGIVSKKLHKLIIDNWLKLKGKLGENENKGEKLKIDLRYETNTLKLFIVEEINGDDNTFFVSQRSKGFYWFLNFIFKTHFNPKANIKGGAIYLLDEPGSYLHSSAQQGLCELLKDLGKENIVIYNTHSQYLIHANFLSKVRIPYKDTNNNGNIKLVHFSEYKSQNSQIDALQPIRDALKVEPSILENYLLKDVLVLLEGITDFFSFDMFLSLEQKKNIGLIPCRGADTIIQHIPFLMLYDKKKILCVLDNDKKGIPQKTKIEKDYPQVVQVILLEEDVKGIEGFYDLGEVNAVREICSFEEIKTLKNIKNVIPLLYRKKDNNEVMAKLTNTTRKFNGFYNNEIKNLVNTKEN